MKNSLMSISAKKLPKKRILLIKVIPFVVLGSNTEREETVHFQMPPPNSIIFLPEFIQIPRLNQLS